MADWHYLTDDQQQHGPVDDSQLRALAGAGRLRPTDRVWQDGLAEWIPASRVRDLFSGDSSQPLSIAAEPATAVPLPVAPIAYFNANDLDAQAKRALKGFPPFTGTRGEWPLGEAELRQLQLTAQARRPLLRAAFVYNAVFYGGVFVAVFLLAMILQIVNRVNQLGVAAPSNEIGKILGWIALILGLSVLSLFAARGVYRAQPWAPITMIVHFSGWIIYDAYEFVSGYRLMGGTTPELLLMFLFSLVPPAAFLVISVIALQQTKRFLKRPLWTVHALVSSKL